MARLRGGRLRWAIAGVLVVALVVAVIAAWPLVQRYTGAADVTLLFSVAGPDAVHQLQSDPALQKAIGGVSVFQGLVDMNLVTWVHQRTRQHPHGATHDISCLRDRRDVS